MYINIEVIIFKHMEVRASICAIWGLSLSNYRRNILIYFAATCVSKANKFGTMSPDLCAYLAEDYEVISALQVKMNRTAKRIRQYTLRKFAVGGVRRTAYYVPAQSCIRSQAACISSTIMRLWPEFGTEISSGRCSSRRRLVQKGNRMPTEQWKWADKA